MRKKVIHLLDHHFHCGQTDYTKMIEFISLLFLSLNQMQSWPFFLAHL